MSVGVRTGSIVNEVGASSFFNAFFSTIVALLENNQVGSRYPEISINFYEGKIDADKVLDALNELKEIKKALIKYPPSSVVWDLDDKTKLPPWGSKISSDITSMADYFVTNTGRDLFEVLFESFEYAAKKSFDITIEEI